MTTHMPPIPPASQSNKGPKTNADSRADTTKAGHDEHPAEQGETANIKQNTTNKGYFHGRSVK